MFQQLTVAAPTSVKQSKTRAINMPKTDKLSPHYRPQRSWGKVMFSQACVILFTGGGVSASVHAGMPHPLEQTPPQQTPPGTRYTPQEQTPPRPGAPRGSRHPPRPGTPLGADTPPEQTPPGPGAPPRTRYTPSPRPGTPLGADTPPEQTPPGPGAPPRTRYTPSPRADTTPTPTPPAHSMLGDTVNARAVRILLECNLVLFMISESANNGKLTSVIKFPVSLHCQESMLNLLIFFHHQKGPNGY